MFTKFFQKDPSTRPPSPSQPTHEVEDNVSKRSLTQNDVNPRVALHYGIPSTASVLAFDPIQSLLAIGTLDGRIKVIGGENIEGLLVSPKQLPFKHLKFLQNQGFLVSVSNENEIQVWDLGLRQMTFTLQWESNITAFSVIHGSSYMYVGDEFGMVSVLKYDTEEVKLIQMPYSVPTAAIPEASGMSSPNHQSIVGVLSQPSSHGNRMLIAYEDGLIILWDISEDKVILVKGNKDLKLKRKIAADSQKDMGHEYADDGSDCDLVEKEISSLCWASNNGSVLAVGYVDGDIIFWNLSTATSAKDKQAEISPNDVVKLQLSSNERRLPVIVLHWSENRSNNECRGQLFVYGGDTIGSEEVLTILRLDWSSGIESLKCTSRVDLTLIGSFADMVLLSSAEMETCGTLVLTSPGQLHFYDDACLLPSSMSQHEKKNSVSSKQYPVVIPAIEPYMTVAKVGLVCRDEKFSRALSKAISAAKRQAENAPRSANWPLTGGIPSQLVDAENYQVEKVYVAGYQDGSVRIWDATYPTFSLIHVLGPEVNGINVTGVSASVSALEFCSMTLSLAIGNELGMVRLYKLIGSTDEVSLNFVTETETKVYSLQQGDGPQCTAVFTFLNSPICTLQFANFGTRLAVGFHCGRVAMLDIVKSSVLFLTDSLHESSLPVNILAVKSFPESISLISNPEDPESERMEGSVKWVVFIITKDAHFVVIDGNIGSIICSQSIQSVNGSIIISANIIDYGNLIAEVSSEKQAFNSSQISEVKGQPVQPVDLCGNIPLKVGTENSTATAHIGQRVENFFLLLCCEDALHLYSLKSLNEGDSNPIRKVNILKPCCWIRTFKKDDKECGLIVLCQTGEIEIRSLPDLEVVAESSLMSILRWNFKTNMQKTICSSETAQIMLVNGCEFASVSVLAHENDFRIPESLPCLHDKVLATVANTTVTLSPSQKKKQGAVSGILGGLIKGFQTETGEHGVDIPEICDFAHLDSIFSSPPFSKSFTSFEDDQDVVELSIDDIDIDEPVFVTPISEKSQNDKGTEKERLFEGATSNSKPRLRTAEEIRAKYRKEDASAAAAQARDKLVQRQEKLERLSLRTQELQDGAENFASMAHELAKQMEKRKWWNI